MHSPAPLRTAPPAGTGSRNRVAARVDDGDAGAGHAAAERRVRLVAPHRGVADADAGDVDDRAGGAARQRPDPDSQLSGTRHSREPNVVLNLPAVWAEDCRAARAACARCGSACRCAGTELPERATILRDAVRDAGARIVPAVAHADDVAGLRPRARTAGAPVDGARGVAGRRVRRAGRPGPGGAVRVPDRRDARRAPGAPADRDPRPGRPVLLRHDDAGRAGHLGGRAGRRRRRADRRRPGGRGRAGGVRHLPPAGPPRDPRRRTAAPAISTTRPSRRAALRAAGVGRVAVVDVDAHHGNGTQAIFYDRAGRVLRLGARRPGGGLVPALRRASPTRPARRRRWAPTVNVPVAPGAGDDGWLAGARRGLRRVRRRSGPTRVVLSLGVDAAADDPESPLTGHRGRLPPLRRAGPRRSAFRSWPCTRAATTCRRWGR